MVSAADSEASSLLLNIWSLTQKVFTRHVDQYLELSFFVKIARGLRVCAVGGLF